MAWSFCRRCSSSRAQNGSAVLDCISKTTKAYVISTACYGSVSHIRRRETTSLSLDSRCSRKNLTWRKWSTLKQKQMELSFRRFCSDTSDKGEDKMDKKAKIFDKIEKFKEAKEDIMTVPNLLSTLRILASPLLGYLVIQEQFLGAVILFGFAGISDLLDGYIARNFKNQRSVLGTILDPTADKLLISILTVSLSVVSLLPAPLTALILGRDVGLISCAMYLRYKSLPQPKTLGRYFDVNLPSVEFRPTLISKVNTALQLGLVGCSLAAPVFDLVNHPLLQVSWYIVGSTTILSGLSYVFSKTSTQFVNCKDKTKQL